MRNYPGIEDGEKPELSRPSTWPFQAANTYCFFILVAGEALLSRKERRKHILLGVSVCGAAELKDTFAGMKKRER
jgi:hypothetical protein